MSDPINRSDFAAKINDWYNKGMWGAIANPNAFDEVAWERHGVEHETRRVKKNKASSEDLLILRIPQYVMKPNMNNKEVSFYIIGLDDFPELTSANGDGKLYNADSVPLKYSIDRVLNRIEKDGNNVLGRVLTGGVKEHPGEWLDKLDNLRFFLLFHKYHLDPDSQRLRRLMSVVTNGKIPENPSEGEYLTPEALYDMNVIKNEYDRRSAKKRPYFGYKTFDEVIDKIASNQMTLNDLNPA